MSQKNFFLFSILFLVAFYAQKVEATVLSGPTCFVKVEVVSVGSEKRMLSSGRDYESSYIDLKVLGTPEDNKACPVSKDQIYRATDNYPGTFKVGDMLTAGIERAMSMGPTGTIPFLQWSSIKRKDGVALKVDFLQSDDKPIKNSGK